MKLFCRFAAVLLVVAAALPLCSQTNAMTPAIPSNFTPPRTNYDYVKRVAMVPMRDGVKLYTVIVVPKGAMMHRFC